MESLYKLFAVIWLVAMLRQLINAVHGKAIREQQSRAVAWLFAFLVACFTIVSMWYLGVRI